ncbi:MAG: hypothetical protein DMF06_13335 [Verrucomicrobia bacterium]|jgi:hypothetical protein|nr:MAG: hypothetical protein DMF06_13335 [Verrucomicrobiota bacterium]
MNVGGRFIIVSILAPLGFMGVPNAPAQVIGGKTPEPLSATADAALLQKKASEAQARIRGNEDESNQVKKAVKTNEVAVAREILLRNGFTAKDLEGAKIILRTGGGKGGEDTIEIFVTCCDPREITLQRTVENFTKTNR